MTPQGDAPRTGAEQIGWGHKDATGRWFFHADVEDHLGCVPVYAMRDVTTLVLLVRRVGLTGALRCAAARLAYLLRTTPAGDQ